MRGLRHRRSRPTRRAARRAGCRRPGGARRPGARPARARGCSAACSLAVVRRRAADRRRGALSSAASARSSARMHGTEDRRRSLVLLAELIVRHTRRHMPTRRVALEGAYLPTSGPAHGVALLAAVVATNLPGDRRRAARAAAAAARRRAPRALDPAHRAAAPPPARRARPRPVAPPHARRGRQARRRDRRARRADAAGARRGAGRGGAAASSGRSVALDAIRRVVDGRWGGLAPDVEVRVRRDRDVGRRAARRSPARGRVGAGRPAREEVWRGVGPDQRWAMEVLGLRAGHGRSSATT